METGMWSDIGFYNQHLCTRLRYNAGSNIFSRRFTQIINIGFKGKSHASHYRFTIVLLDKLLTSFHYFVGTPISFIIVRLTGTFDDLCLFGIVRNNKPGIYGYTVSSHSAAGLQDVHTRMFVSQFYQFPDVDTRFVTNHGQFVGKRNLRVARRVLGQLTHFCRTSIRRVEFTLYKGRIKLYGFSGRLGIDATDHPIVMN